MKRHGFTAEVVDVLTLLLRPMVALLRVSGPVLRVWRLAVLRSQICGMVPVSTQFDGPVRALGRGEVRFGSHCRLGRDVQIDTGDAGQLTLGDCVRINAGAVVVANSRVTIGDYTLIGEYVSIRDSNHGTAIGSLIREQPQVSSDIKIGRDVWIGRGCCILAGVTIADGAVIGANSVVTRDVSENSICVGSPAREIGSRKRGESSRTA